ncbi:hypothetical protein [Novosphingobium resinovorum]|uniref:Uncharacterized protein n=1 Tax=Novosphingobium resinovorum TaxID=158500 RepID=A0A1D8A361_9SPHN|nr:hypothetical protein [Novosphingobium resinovorum]AOR76581.1 hypothetical protein BES08_07330 [Novosphingobium resinovorum]
MTEATVQVAPFGFVEYAVQIGEAPAYIPADHYLALAGQQIVAAGPWPPTIDLARFKLTRLYVPAAFYAEIRQSFA